MQDNKKERLTIRAAKSALSFALPDIDSNTQIEYYQYVTKSGVSLAANLREAFKTVDLLQQAPPKAKVLIDSQSLIVPLEEYDADENEALYKHAFPYTEGAVICSNVMADINAVVLFALNKDLKLVVEDHFQDVSYVCLMRPVWDYLHHRSFIGNRRKLYAYFHDGVLELFSFERNRFIFCNRYDVRHVKDAVYFILFVWKQLAMDQLHDELFLVGDLIDKDELLKDLRTYVAFVVVINPQASFNRAPLTQIKGITFDMITNYLG